MFTTKNVKDAVAVAKISGKKSVLRYVESETPEPTLEEAIEKMTHIGSSSASVKAPAGSKFEPIPPSLSSSRERDVFFMSGKSGSGKSYMSASLIKYYRAFKKKVFVITDIPDKKFQPCMYLDIDDFVGVSATFEKQKTEYEEAKIRFKYKKKMIEDPDDLIQLEIQLNKMKPKVDDAKRMEFKYSPEEMSKIFTNSVVLFDDYENNKDNARIEFLRDTLLTKGRHTHTSLLICNHKTNFGLKSALIMCEGTNFILFKKNTPRSRQYFLKSHIDYTKSQIRQVENSLKSSRWVMIDRDLGFLMSEQFAWTE
jgi:hypothetical protein